MTKQEALDSLGFIVQFGVMDQDEDGPCSPQEIANARAIEKIAEAMLAIEADRATKEKA